MSVQGHMFQCMYQDQATSTDVPADWASVPIEAFGECGEFNIVIIHNLCIFNCNQS